MAISSGSVTRSRTEDHPFPDLSIATQSASSQIIRFLAMRGFWRKSKRGGLPTWEIGVTKSSSNCGSQAQNIFPPNLLSATITRMTEGDHHYLCPTMSRDEFDDPSISILSSAAPTA
jgi:hypothetical protein